MKHLALILTVAVLAGTALAQVTAADYQAWRRAERATYANDSLTAYQAWRAAEQASYQQLGPTASQAWLGIFSQQEFDAARRILPDVAYWSGTDAVYRVQRAPETYDRLSGRFIEGNPNGVAVAVPQQEQVILRGLAGPLTVIAPAQAPESLRLRVPNMDEWFEP